MKRIKKCPLGYLYKLELEKEFSRITHKGSANLVRINVHLHIDEDVFNCE